VPTAHPPSEDAAVVVGRRGEVQLADGDGSRGPLFDEGFGVRGTSAEGHERSGHDALSEVSGPHTTRSLNAIVTAKTQITAERNH
jgi:hypothetical protein